MKTIDKNDIEEFCKWLKLEETNAATEKLRLYESFFYHFFYHLEDFHEFQRRIARTRQIFHPPLYGWLDWFESKFIIYHFINSGMELKEFCSDHDFDVRDVRYKLETHLREYNLSKTTNYKKILKQPCLLPARYQELNFVNYPEWKEGMKNATANHEIKVNKNENWVLKNVFRCVAVIALCFGLSALYHYWNKSYQDRLKAQITFLDEATNDSLPFLGLQKVESKQVEIGLKNDELNKLKEAEENEEPFINPVRVGPESDYVSDIYEEVDKDDFRDRTYGRRNAYRLIINSVESEAVRDKVNLIYKKFKVQPYGRVNPGQEIPGGFYYNLFVEKDDVKILLEQLQALEPKSVLYIARSTASDVPAGHEKLFIWIKSM